MKFEGTEKWVLGRKKGSYQYISGEDWKDFARVVVKMKGTNYTSSMGEANLKLIIAAPELLKALQDLSNANQDDSSWNYQASLDQAKNAIEKALK